MYVIQLHSYGVHLVQIFTEVIIASTCRIMRWFYYHKMAFLPKAKELYELGVRERGGPGPSPCSIDELYYMHSLTVLELAA